MKTTYKVTLIIEVDSDDAVPNVTAVLNEHFDDPSYTNRTIHVPEGTVDILNVKSVDVDFIRRG